MLSIIEKLEEYKDSESVDYLESALEDLRHEDQERGLTVHCLTQAQDQLGIARSNLLSALAHSTAVEALLIEPEIRHLVEITQRLKRLGDMIE
jgi:hypothetical protein